MNSLIVDTQMCDKDREVQCYLSGAGKAVYESKAFGVKTCTDNDTALLVQDLHEMLLAKRNGSECYSDISENLIISLINKYTR